MRKIVWAQEGGGNCTWRNVISCSVTENYSGDKVKVGEKRERRQHGFREET
jgi:hypothetical protein